MPPKKASDFESRQKRLDFETATWAADANRKIRKEDIHCAHIEAKRMKAADDRSALVEQASRQSSSSRPDRPDPLFQPGQSVHQYWAPWFSGTGPGGEPQLRKKSRPSWYSGEVSSVPTWKTIDYAGSTVEGWTYLTY